LTGRKKAQTTQTLATLPNSEREGVTHEVQQQQSIKPNRELQLLCLLRLLAAMPEAQF
jgi:hypothetical protein